MFGISAVESGNNPIIFFLHYDVQVNNVWSNTHFEHGIALDGYFAAARLFDFPGKQKHGANDAVGLLVDLEVLLSSMRG